MSRTGQVLKVMRKHLKPDQRIFVGVITPIERYIEAPKEVRVRTFEPGEKWRRCYVDG
jgi:5-methyltetrahydropteroyltriglutamate--homocysteine methyltransferase